MIYRVLHEAHAEAAEAFVWLVVKKRYEVARRLWGMWEKGQDAIEANPQMYPRTEDGPSHLVTRNYILPKYGYRIVYQITSTEVVVLFFCRGKRRPDHWVKRIRDV